MEPLHHKLNRFLSLLLVFAMVLTFVPAFAVPARAAELPTGSNENGYVTNVPFFTKRGSDVQISGYSFDPAVTDYDVVLTDTNTAFYFQICTASDRPENLWYQLLLDGAVFPGASANYNKRITADAMSSAAILAKYLPMGESHTISLLVGVKDDAGSEFENCDVYNFRITKMPGLKSLGLKDEAGAAIQLSPTFDAALTAYADRYIAVTQSSTILLSAGVATNGVKLYLGDEETAGLANREITLAEYTAEGSDIAVIPLRLVYDVEGKLASERQIQLYISKTDHFPQITAQPAAVTCDKDDSPALSVGVAEPERGTISYQWRTNINDNKTSMKTIPGATGASYIPPTDWAGDTYYDCVITNTVDGIAYTVTSDTVQVTVNLSYVSAPVIVNQLGTFQKTKQNDLPYKTTYTAGEKFDTMRIRVRYPEPGVELTYELFHNTVNALEGAEPVVLDTNAVFGDTNTQVINGVPVVGKGFRSASGYGEGKHYFYCVITATDTGNPARTASTTSEIVELTFVQKKLDGFAGRGTEADPYLIQSAGDFVRLRELVNGGQWCAGVCFQMTGDITLPEDWETIGYRPEGGTSGEVEAFSGTLDGNGYTLTVPEGSKPLLGYVSDAVIRNLNIYGKRIEGCGLIDSYFVDYGADGDYWTGVPAAVTLENVRLLSGSSTLRSGFMEGSGSGANTITIRNCVVEDNVTIGYDGLQSGIGSFVGGAFNGQIDNSYSHATVYGEEMVGGLAGGKGQSMGLCVIRNSGFQGKIVATGDWVGGIIGMGYYSDSAPNTPPVSFQNCYVVADITGNNYIGGIFGGERGLEAAVNQCFLTDSMYYGTITAKAENATVGGIIGYYRGINNCQQIENNYFYETSGTATQVLGGYGHIDVTDVDGLLAAMGSAETKEAMADGTVLALLNAGTYKNWVQDEKYPVHSKEAVVESLTVSGTYKTRYYLGEELDLSGIRFSAKWSNGSVTYPSLDEVEITGYDPNFQGYQTLTAAYGAAKAEIGVSVRKKYTGGETYTPVKVSFSLSDDGRFVTSSVTGESMAGVEIDLAYFDLADYGLEKFYCYDENRQVIEQPTMLHLYIRMLETYYLDEGESLADHPEALTVSGAGGALYMTSFWGHDQNLTYYYNGKYPLAGEAWGATADQILLKDGDFVDLAMFTDWNFWSDSNAGFRYFLDDAGSVTHAYTAVQDTAAQFTYAKAQTDWSGDYGTGYVAAPGATVYYGTELYGSTAQSTVTDEAGVARITFPTDGLWYLWTAGQKGSETDGIVSAPAYAKVTVITQDQAAAQAAEALIDAIGEVTLDSKEAIEAARKAYDALTEAQKALVGNYEVLTAAEAAYRALLEAAEDAKNKAAAKAVEALIDAIGPVTPDSGEAIEAAREAYDELTELQKALVSNYDKLVAAEKAYAELTTELPFTDVKEGAWYYDAVRYTYANDLFRGVTETTFAPNATMTRGMLVTVLYRMEHEPAVSGQTHPFTDVSANRYYSDAITWAAGNGVVKGVTQTLFAPERPVTREQMVTILYRYAGLKGYDITAEGNLNAFPDGSKVKNYAKDAMAWAIGSGMICGSYNNGVTTLSPGAQATRAQVAVILMRYLQKFVP